MSIIPKISIKVECVCPKCNAVGKIDCGAVAKQVLRGFDEDAGEGHFEYVPIDNYQFRKRESASKFVFRRIEKYTEDTIDLRSENIINYHNKDNKFAYCKSCSVVMQIISVQSTTEFPRIPQHCTYQPIPPTFFNMIAMISKIIRGKW